MRPHPDFSSVELPREVALGTWRLTRLAPEFVDEDYAAVMATAHLLEDVLGDWPAGLTRDDNLIDLAWHEREFTTRRSFSWILRDEAGVYTGCFYIFPDIGSLGHASAVLWLCDIPRRRERAIDLKAALRSWLTKHLPNTIKLTWHTSPRLDG